MTIFELATGKKSIIQGYSYKTKFFKKLQDRGRYEISSEKWKASNKILLTIIQYNV